MPDGLNVAKVEFGAVCARPDFERASERINFIAVRFSTIPKHLSAIPPFSRFYKDKQVYQKQRTESSR